MNIEEQRHGDVVVLRVSGIPWGLRRGHVLALAPIVERHLESGGEAFVLDLGSAKALHDSNLAEVFAAFARIVKAGGRVALVRPHAGSSAGRLWDFAIPASTQDSFNAFDTLDDALESLAGPRTD